MSPFANAFALDKGESPCCGDILAIGRGFAAFFCTNARSASINWSFAIPNCFIRVYAATARPYKSGLAWMQPLRDSSLEEIRYSP